MSKNFLLTEKYRPKTIVECILPSSLKEVFEGIISDGNLPNYIFNGPPGLGKTSVARALLDDLEYDVLFINGSTQNSIDVLRNDIQQFVSTVSFTGSRKAVIIDEAERMSPAMQDGMKSFMEEFAGNATFIMTSNNASKLIGPIHSRCAVLDFTVSKEDHQKLLTQFFKKLLFILEQEKIEYDKAVVAKLLSKFFPDFRRVLNEIQSYSKRGPIDSGILAAIKEVSLNALFKDMKEKNFSNIRKWVSDNSNYSSEVYRKIFDTVDNYFTPNTIPLVILTVAKYQYQSCYAVDQEVNLTACLVEILVDAEFK